MNVSIFVAAVVFIQNEGAQSERPARPVSVFPTASFPCRTDNGVTPLLAAPDQHEEDAVG